MKKILIIEDDSFIAKAYQIKLERLGYEVWLASDGKEGLEILEQRLPDLILLDLVMPKMDGFAFLEKIKADPKLKQIPVIVSSNLGQSEDMTRAKSLGANDYIVKTNMSLAELVKKVERFISSE